MGSCISKCSPKSHFQVEEDDQFCNHIQDKLVISTQPPKPITPIIPSHHHSNKISPIPSSPSHSTSSASSVSYCTTTNSNSTLNSSNSTLSSSASSISSSSKIDRSFSNEFLWSCYKENQHISRIASIKEAQKPIAAVTLRKHNQQQQQPSPINRGNVSAKTTPQKRLRNSTSPTLKRQKSFRKEPEKPVISRSLRSPSPSRRFNVTEKNRGITVTANPPKKVSNLRPASPNHNNTSGLMSRPCLKSPARETRIHRISSKIDEVAVREALAHDHYMETVPEDIDNPLISLDCFIFL